MHTKPKTPSQEYLKSILYYDGEYLMWKMQKSHGTKIGAIAGTLHIDGYRYVIIDYTRYLTHYLIWKMVYGSEPKDLIHLDGDKTNNKLNNITTAK